MPALTQIAVTANCVTKPSTPFSERMRAAVSAGSSGMQLFIIS